MSEAPVTVVHELSGWRLLWAELEIEPGSEGAHAVLVETMARVRSRHGAALSAEDPTIAAIRRLFRAAGCDPTRYRPSSEALLRRVLKGEDLAPIHPLVDLNNALSIELAVPSCIMAEGTIAPPVVLRAGAEGETFESLRGPFSLAGKPLLADARGAFGTPITDSVRVKVHPDTRRGWLVAYLPAEVVPGTAAEKTLHQLAAMSKATVGALFTSP